MRTTLMVAAAALALTASAAASEWQDIKDPSELRALYSGKTFRGTGWVGHYRADGSGVLIVQGSQPVRRTWAIKDPDQVCVTPETGSVQCFTFKYVSADHKQVLVTNVSTGGSVIFTVEDGVPNF